MPGMMYNSPPTTKSSIDGAGSNQLNTYYYNRKALIDAAKEAPFSAQADTTMMPKNMGKEIRCYYYVPLLDVRNVNDQGIDAAGVTLLPTEYFVSFPRLTVAVANATKAAAATAIQDNASGVTAVAGADGSAGAGLATITLSATFAKYSTLTKANAVAALNVGAVVSQAAGNLYGSSKDIGTITGRIPALGENGGRVNRVGSTRIQRTGSIQKFGIFQQFNQEMMDFDSDADLYEHISRELITGATQLTEAILQKDILAGAGTLLYAGIATSKAEITAEGANPSIVNYTLLQRLQRTLNDNRTPKQTKIISGSQMTDTRTIAGGRIIYIGSELESIVRNMLDPFNQPAFIPVHKYADAGNLIHGEIGSIDQLRFVVVPEMLNWAGAGAAMGTNPGYMATNGRYDVFPMLIIGEGSFTTVGFASSGKMFKFKIITKMPGEANADLNDPFGEQGFSSIKWWYGTMFLRPERIGLIHTVAKI